MKFLFYSLICVFFISCNNNDSVKNETGEKPTKEDVIAAMKKAYEYTTTAGDQFKLDVQEVKIGNSDVANLKQEMNEIPKGTIVTNVEVNYTITGNITVTKSAMLWVYKNEFGEWKFKATSGSNS